MSMVAVMYGSKLDKVCLRAGPIISKPEQLLYNHLMDPISEIAGRTDAPSRKNEFKQGLTLLHWTESSILAQDERWRRA